MRLTPKTAQIAVLAVLAVVCLHSALAQTQYCLNRYRFPCVQGTCQPISSKSDREECKCDTGYTGTSCNIPIDPCSIGPCLNGANCTIIRNATGNNYGRYSCDCPDGYAGDACEIDIELACENIECPENSVCQFGEQDTYDKNDDDRSNDGPDFYCACAPGYIQASSYEDYSKCLPVDPCLSNPCLNNGNCTTVTNGTTAYRNRFVRGTYTCTCPTGFTGHNCQSSTNACASNPCTRRNTVCENTSNGKYKCVCDSNHYGSKCNKPVNPCLDEPCANGGQCEVIRNGTSHKDGKYKCSCAAGFAGHDCDLNMNQECERYGVYCKGNRVCIYSPKNKPVSKPPSRRRFDDDDEIEEEIVVIKKRPNHDDDDDDDDKRRKRDASISLRAHRGRNNHDDYRQAKSKKTISKDDFYCACADGYFPASTRDQDSKCVSLDPCNDSNRCKNGGVCYTLQNGTYVEAVFRPGMYRCDCSSTGYTGPNCEISVNPCASNPCARENKVCKVKRNGSYKCECASGTFGTGCTLKTINPCSLDENKCSEDSQCINKANATVTLSNRLVDSGKYTCRCDRGYLGKYCQHKKCVDRYVSKRCQDDQVCVVVNDESKCLDKSIVGETDTGRSSNDRDRRRNRDDDDDDDDQDDDDQDEDDDQDGGRRRGGRGGSGGRGSRGGRGRGSRL